jgi:uncharacterized protein (DUF1697 family)
VEVSTQFAFLRGVNVGGRNKVPMAALRAMLEGLGFGDVRTLLQSGNAVYTTDRAPERAAREIHEQIEERLGLSIAVLVRTHDELASVVAGDPFAEVATEPARYLVTFLSGQPDPERLRAIDADGSLPDAFAAGERELYVWCPNGVSETPYSYAFWEKQLGLTATARNWNTVTKLLALAGG